MSLPRKSFKTPKGTELPILNLRGKEYLQIMHRLVWMREERPKLSVSTEMVQFGGTGKDAFYVFKAVLTEDNTVLSTGHKRETVGDFPDAMEKAEMGAIGRALGVLGYGTQFAADDLEEGMRLADSPAPVLEKAANVATGKAVAQTTPLVKPAARAGFRKPVAEVVADNGDI